MKYCGTHFGCRSRFSATNARFVSRKAGNKILFVGLLTYACKRGCNLFSDRFGLPGIASSDRLSPKNRPQHLQRRYRSGFSPDYLVQQTQPYATPATKKYPVVERIIAQAFFLVNRSICPGRKKAGTANTDKWARKYCQWQSPGNCGPAADRRCRRLPSAAGFANKRNCPAP